MKPKNHRKLILNRETVAVLNSTELDRVVGGVVDAAIWSNGCVSVLGYCPTAKCAQG